MRKHTQEMNKAKSLRQIKNLLNKRFTKLIVTEYIGQDKNGDALWRCKCDCGNECIILGYCLTSENNRSCGCLNKERKGNHKPWSEKSKLKLSLKLKGKLISENQKEKQKNTMIKRYCDINERKKTSKSVKIAMHRPDIRKKHLDALSETKYLGKSVDRNQVKFIEKWNSLGFNFKINYQIKTDEDLFYVDGYDKEKNIVLEFDSKYHNKLSQKKKDLIRQNKIINILKPNKFWRYDEENKKLRNVLESIG